MITLNHWYISSSVQIDDTQRHRAQMSYRFSNPFQIADVISLLICWETLQSRPHRSLPAYTTGKRIPSMRLRLSDWLCFPVLGHYECCFHHGSSSSALRIPRPITNSHLHWSDVFHLNIRVEYSEHTESEELYIWRYCRDAILSWFAWTSGLVASSSASTLDEVSCLALPTHSHNHKSTSH